jgi:hypothetical protein
LALGGYEPQGNVEWRIKYEREHKNWEKTIARFLPCELALHNTGSAEASDIRIDFELPDFITAWASDEVPKAPKPPRSLFEPMDLSDIVPLSHHFRERPAGKPYTDYDNAAVWFRIPSLVHNRVLTCHRFFFKFSEEANIQNFSLPYIITCADLIDPITGTLGFVTKDEEGTEE